MLLLDYCRFGFSCYVMVFRLVEILLFLMLGILVVRCGKIVFCLLNLVRGLIISDEGLRFLVFEDR